MLDHTDPAARALAAASLDATPDNAMRVLSRLALGPVNTDYYLAVFDRFDNTGRTTTSWNWAASVNTVNWMVFRQLWSASLVYLAAAEGVALALYALGRSLLQWPLGVEVGVLGAFAMLAFAVPGLYGNAILYADIRKRVGKALAASRTLPEACAVLQKQASTRKRLQAVAIGNGVLVAAAALAYLLWSPSPSPAARPLALEPSVTVAQASASAAAASASASASATASGLVSAAPELAAEPAETAEPGVPSKPPGAPAEPPASAAVPSPPPATPPPGKAQGSAPASAPLAPASSPDAAAGKTLSPPAGKASAPRTKASTPAKTAAAPPTSSTTTATASEPAPRPNPAAKAKPKPLAQSSPAPSATAASSATAAAPASPDPLARVGSAAGYYINVGLFADEANARKAQARLLNEGLPAFRQELDSGKGRRIRVRVGPYASLAQAQEAAASIRAMSLEAVVFKR